jgi:hypothetical protein
MKKNIYSILLTIYVIIECKMTKTPINNLYLLPWRRDTAIISVHDHGDEESLGQARPQAVMTYGYAVL